MFRLGDFYEMFDDDAQTAARELDLVLTRAARLKVSACRCAACHITPSRATSPGWSERGYHVAVVEQVGRAG